MVTTRPPKTIVKPMALGPVVNTDTKLLIYGLFQKGRVLAQDAEYGGVVKQVLGGATSYDLPSSSQNSNPPHHHPMVYARFPSRKLNLGNNLRSASGQNTRTPSGSAVCTFPRAA